MRKEIEKALLELEIEGKEARKKTARNISIIVTLAVAFYLIPYFYPQLQALFGIEVLIVLFGGMYVVFGAIPTLYQPLKQEFYAFQKIARAIELLEKSNEPIAYEEAYRCVNKAFKILKGIELKKDINLYEKINQTFEHFLENLQLIVLPAIANSNVKKEHLEEIALALNSINSSEIEVMNKTLESEPSYKKAKPPPRRMETFTRIFRESSIGRVLTFVSCGIGGLFAFYVGYYVLFVPLEHAYTVGFGFAGVLIGAYLNYVRK